MTDTNLTDTGRLSPEQIRAFVTEDVLERDPVTFVKIRKTGRLGWESSLPQGSAYSSFILNPKSKEDLIRNAYNIASNMIASMNAPFKVKVRLDPSQSRTDAKDLFVATNMLDDEELPLGIRLDTFIGDAVHEGCHLLYTQFGTRRGVKTERFVRMLANVLEDERIERILGEKKPGLANFIISMKYWSFDRYEQSIDKQKIDDTLVNLFNAILHFVRYPKSLSEDDLQQFGEVLYNVKEVLTPFPSSTEEAYQKAEKIYQLMKEFVKQNAQQQQEEDGDDEESGDGQSQKGEQGQDGQSDNSQCPGEGGGENADGGQQQQNGKSGGNGSGDKDSDSDRDGQSGSGASGDGSQSQEQQSKESGDENGGQQSEGMSDEEAERAIDDAMKQIEDMVNELTGNDANEDKMSQTLRDDSLLAKECEGELERGVASNLIVTRAGENKMEYECSLRRVSPYIGAISKSLRYNDSRYDYCLLGMRNGKLDTNKLAEAVQGAQTVYCQKGSVRAEKASVVLLIDESGSMWGEGERAARDTAVLINEAVSKIRNVELFIYGFTSGKLRTFKDGKTVSRYALGTTDSMGGTPTREAILEVTARVRKQTQTPCLFFVISDGDPDGSLQGVRRAVDEAQGKGFTVVGVNIGKISVKALDVMYPQWVTYDSLNGLAPKLSGVIRKSIIKMTSRKTQA